MTASMTSCVHFVRFWLSPEIIAAFIYFFLIDTAASQIYTLSLHDALPIRPRVDAGEARQVAGRAGRRLEQQRWEDRKSTRLNSSHRCISYAVFCLKKKRSVAARDARTEAPYADLHSHRIRSAVNERGHEMK